MFIQFTIHIEEPSERQAILTWLSSRFAEYLFEGGPFWFKTPRGPLDSLRIIGYIRCGENIENARYLTLSLVDLTLQFSTVVCRVFDRTLDQDYLTYESDD